MQQIKKLFRDYQGIVISICIILLCAAGFLFGIIPLIENTFNLIIQEKTHAAHVAALNQKIAVLQSVDENSLRANLQTLLSAVPSNESISSVFSTLDGLSTLTGVTLDTISMSQSTSLATPLTSSKTSIGSSTTIPVTINLSGSLDQIQSFLTMSVGVRRLFRVLSFSIASPQNKNASASAALLTAIVQLDGFYSPIPTSIGSVDQSISGLTASDTSTIAKIAAMQLMTAPATNLPPPSSGVGKIDPFSP
jgi:Tfp pilus assembly protein PilO